MSPNEARASLSEAGLTVSDDRREEYSNEVDEGRVTGIAPRGEQGNWRPGNTATLIVSLGPRPVPVPNVNDRTIREAVDILEDAGFEVNANLDDGELPLGFRYWDVYRVRSTSPAAGQTALPGSTISLTPGLG